jgi:hypothetical protein
MTHLAGTNSDRAGRGLQLRPAVGNVLPDLSGFKNLKGLIGHSQNTGKSI